MPLPPLSTLSLSHGRLAFREAGSGPPLVLLHGLGGGSASWEEQIAAFSSERRVIAWDCPGYGGSDDLPGAPSLEDYAAALEAFLVALGIGELDLLGHSMGGAIAPRLAARHPDRVRRLVLSCTRADFTKRDPGQFTARLAELESLPRAEFGRRRALGMTAPDADPAVRARVAAIAAEVRPSGYGAAAGMLERADNSDVLPRLPTPTLVVSATEDRIALAHEAETLARLIPNAERVVIEGAGHAPYLERPAQYNDALRRFTALTDR